LFIVSTVAREGPRRTCSALLTCCCRWYVRASRPRVRDDIGAAAGGCSSAAAVARPLAAVELKETTVAGVTSSGGRSGRRQQRTLKKSPPDSGQHPETPVQSRLQRFRE